MDGPPNSFQLSILKGWQMADAQRPGTSQTTLHELAAGQKPAPLGAIRVDLAELPQGAEGPGLSSQLRFEDTVAGAPATVDLGVGFYVMDQPNEHELLRDALAPGAPGDRFDVVRLQAGPALRRSGARGTGWLWQYYVAVPGTDDEIALLTFVSPDVQPGHQDALGEICDSMSGTFAYRWQEQPPDSPVPDEAIREWIERRAAETGDEITAITPDGGTILASGRPRPATQPGREPNSFIEERYGWRRAGWSSGRPWQATELEAKAAAIPGGTKAQSRAMLVLFVLYAIIALAAAPGVSKAPVVFLGVGILMGVIRTQGQRGWTAVVIAGAALAAVLVLVVGLARG